MTKSLAAAYRRMNFADATIDHFHKLLIENGKEAARKYLFLPDVYDAIAGYYGRSTFETLSAEVKDDTET
jgi:hypothetical protein